MKRPTALCGLAIALPLILAGCPVSHLTRPPTPSTACGHAGPCTPDPAVDAATPCVSDLDCPTGHICDRQPGTPRGACTTEDHAPW